MIQTSTLCIQCRTLVELEDIDSRCCAACECSDYSIDAPMGIGATPEDAVQEWLTRAATYITPLEPSTLATFIVPPPPDGFVLTTDTFTDAIFYGPSEGQKAANQ
jgi:hypothetical protein